MHAASETCPFLAYSSFSACRYRTLLSLHVSRAASMRDFGTAPFMAAALSVWGRARTSLSAWFESTVSHHMAHGLDNPQGRTCNLPCQEKALESLPRCSFPDRMCANQQPRRRTGAVFIWPPERSLERGACVQTRLVRFQGRLLYSGSSSGRAAVSKTVGCRFKACPERHAMYSRGTAVQSIAGHLAAKVPDAAAPTV